MLKQMIRLDDTHMIALGYDFSKVVLMAAKLVYTPERRLEDSSLLGLADRAPILMAGVQIQFQGKDGQLIVWRARSMSQERKSFVQVLHGLDPRQKQIARKADMISPFVPFPVLPSAPGTDKTLKHHLNQLVAGTLSTENNQNQAKRTIGIYVYNM
ncbi:hypothetical protein CF326_g6779 [Tilletia indica]|nr:hypothetical protein CF326_g6779 [Tilletia indica]